MTTAGLASPSRHAIPAAQPAAVVAGVLVAGVLAAGVLAPAPAPEADLDRCLAGDLGDELHRVAAGARGRARVRGPDVGRGRLGALGVGERVLQLGRQLALVVFDEVLGLVLEVAGGRAGGTSPPVASTASAEITRRRMAEQANPRRSGRGRAARRSGGRAPDSAHLVDGDGAEGGPHQGEADQAVAGIDSSYTSQPSRKLMIGTRYCRRRAG